MRKIFYSALLLSFYSSALTAETFHCVGTHGHVMGTGDNGQFFEGNLDTNDLTISIEPDESLTIFDTNDVEKVRVSDSNWVIENFSRWSFPQHGFFSLRQKESGVSVRDAIFISFFSNGQIGMVKRYNCY